MSYLFIAFLLIVGWVHANDRSGDMQWTSEQIERTTLYSSDVEMWKSKELGASSFANGVAARMGLPALEPRAVAGEVGMFERRRAHVAVLVDGAEVDGTSAFKRGLTQRTAGSDAADFVSGAAAYWSGLSGVQNGVPAAQWVDRASGEVKTAGEVGAEKFAAGLHDVAESSTGHHSVVVTVSNDRQTAKVLAPSSALSSRHAVSSGSLESVYFNGREFTTVYGKDVVVRFPRYVSGIDADAAALHTFLAAGSSWVDSVAVTGNSVHVAVENAEGEKTVVDFSLGVAAFRGFYAELQAMFRVSRFMNSRNGRPLAADERPDFFAFAFSLDAVRDQFGDSAVHMSAIHALIESATASLYHAAESVYGENEVLLSLLYVGSYRSSPAALSVDSLALLKTAVTAQALAAPESFARVFPAVFLRKELSAAERTAACQRLTAALRGASQGHLQCHEPHASSQSALKAVSHLSAVLRDDGSASGDDVAIFQVCVWFSFILFVVTAAAVYPMFYVHELRDEILFSIDFDEQKILGPKLRA